MWNNQLLGVILGVEKCDRFQPLLYADYKYNQRYRTISRISHGREGNVDIAQAFAILLKSVKKINSLCFNFNSRFGCNILIQCGVSLRV